MGDKVLETERLELGVISEEDAEIMLAIWNDPAFIHNVSDRGVRTIEEAREAVRDGAQKMFEDYGYGPYWMQLKSDGTRIGICGLFKRENLDDPDIGFAVLPDWIGKGYAGEAAAAAIGPGVHALEQPALAALHVGVGDEHDAPLVLDDVGALHAARNPAAKALGIAVERIGAAFLTQARARRHHEVFEVTGARTPHACRLR